MSFRVDGQAMATNARAQNIASAEHIESSVDISELKRRIERRDNENKRKDREISLLQKEILTLTKDIHGLRERNDQLQHSLTNARLLTATSREEAETRITNNIIIDLENKLARCEKNSTELIGDNEVLKATVAGLQNQLHNSVGEVTGKNDEVVSLTEELYTVNLKLKTLQIRLNEKDVEMEGVTKQLEDISRTARSLKGELEHKKTQLNTHERSIAELTTELKRAQASLLIKHETNSLLRGQVTDMSDKTLNMTRDEVASFKRIEMDNRSLETRNKELLKSVELHMDLLQRAESENKSLMLARDQTLDDNKALKESIALNTQNQSTSASTFAALKKEVVKLRKENKSFSEKIDMFLAKQRDGNTMNETDPHRLRAGLTTLTRHHQEAAEGHSEERRRRKVAEEAAKALRNRTAFLLEQMEQASRLSATWKEQKSVLKAEISSLHQTNYDLRERLLNVQRNYMDKTLYEFANPTTRRSAKTVFLTDQGTGGGGGGGVRGSLAETNDEAAERLLSSSQGMNQAEAAFGAVAARPLPFTVEGMVERQLFDALCGYSTGERDVFDLDEEEGGSGRRPRRKVELKDSFTAKMREDGLVHVVIERRRGGGDTAARTDADELLAGLQVPAFLKFVQTRHPDKVPYMFTEKIASILNFFRATVQDYLSQLGASRMTGARLQAKISTSAERVASMQHMYSLERISKQKTMMKYVREQLRISDFRKVIDKVSKAGRDSLDEIELQRKELLAASQPSVSQHLPDNNRIRSLMVQLVQVAEQLSATSLYNGQDDTATNNDDVPVGSLEIRLPDSQVDDETLHGVVGLLVGALGPSGGAAGDLDAEPPPGQRVGKEDAFQQGDLALGGGLGLGLTGARLSAATQIAKTFLTVQSNYSDRILLLNLKDNVLTDISCKILSGLVEKTRSLRMLDLRGNMISPVGAKMLFDATRRNQAVLYVTQRQGGFMVEGHREIMGGVQERGSRGGHEHGLGHDESKRLDGCGEEARDEECGEEGGGGRGGHSARGEQKRQPLRIDMRNNNPEQEAIEKLLESNQFTSRTGMREKYHKNLEGDAHHHFQQGQGQPRPKSSSGQHADHVLSRMDRSEEEEGEEGGHRRRPVSATVAGAGMARSYGTSSNSHFASSSNGNKSGNNMFQPTQNRTQQQDSNKPARAQLLPHVGDSDDSDQEGGDGFTTERESDPSRLTEIQKRLAAKENERIIGIRAKDGGAGVGSLLDREIRSLQELHEDRSSAAGASGASVSAGGLGRRTLGKLAGTGSSRKVRPQSASAGGGGGSRGGAPVLRSTRAVRPSSASSARKSHSPGGGAGGGGRKTGGAGLSKSSSDGSVLRRKHKSSTASSMSGGGSSSSSIKNNTTNNAFFHLNPAVLF